MDNLTIEYKESLLHWEFRERMALGIMLVSREAIREAIVELGMSKEYFFFAHTRAIYRAMEAVFNRGYQYTPQLVCKELIESRELNETDGLCEIVDITALCNIAIDEGLTISHLCELLEDHLKFRNQYFMVTRYDRPFNAVFKHKIDS